MNETLENEKELEDVLEFEISDDLKEEASTGEINEDFKDAKEETFTLEDEFKGVEEKTARINAGTMISGMMFISMVDMILPELVVFTYNKFVRKKGEKRLKSTKIRLTKTQKNEIEPLADELIKYYNITGNPAILLAVGIISVYTVNVLEMRDQLREESKLEKEVKKKL